MVETRFRRLQDLFDAALELPDERQDDFAADHCGDDAELRDELLRLLRRHRHRTLLQDRPALPELEPALRAVIPTAFVEGRKVGPYRIDEAIGDGGMGRVYRGIREDGAVAQEVAIKLVRAELMNPALLARFSTERRLLAALDHPGVCRFLDAGTLPEGAPYVVMELVRGQPLFDYCDQHRLDLTQRVILLRKIAAAVAHAHRHLIVHRDIKSGNVLVDRDGEPKLLDFGIAKSIADQGSFQQTATAERFLTPAHAAPEQLRGEPIGVGCDIYALGLLAYGLLAGRPPFDFDGLRAGEIERLLLAVPPPPMSQRAAAGDDQVAHCRGQRSAAALSRALAGDLDTVVAVCLRKSPSERYASVEQLDADLANIQQRRPVHMRGGDRWYRASKFVARHRLAVTLSTLLALSLLVGVAAISWQTLLVARAHDRAVLERDRAQQVVALLQESFIAADPARVAGSSVSVRDVLQSARPRIDVMASSQPEVFVALAATIAEVELGIGLESSAAELAERAIAVARRVDTDRAQLRSLLLVRGRALTGIGDYAQAQAALDEVHTLDEGVERPDWLVEHGRLLGRRAKFPEARDALQRAVAAVQARGPDDELATLARTLMAEALLNLKELPAALAKNAETLAWQRAGLHEQHPRILISRLYRIDMLRRSGALAEAAAEAERVYADIIKIYGHDNALAARAGSALGSALVSIGRREDGIEHYRRALRQWRSSLGQDHAMVVRVTYNLANLMKDDRRHEAEALALFRQAVAAAQVRFGAAADSTHFMRFGLARMLLRLQRGREALRLLTSDVALVGQEGLLPANRKTQLELVGEALNQGRCTVEHGNHRNLRPCIIARRLLSQAQSGRPDGDR